MAKILSIETSCDETSVAIVNWSGSHTYQVLSHVTNSQIALHQQYGGVFPALAKREHTKNIMPLLFTSLKQSNLLQPRIKPRNIDTKILHKISKILDRDADNLEKIILLAEQYKAPNISAVAVTYGPGLEIALWTGFNVARALSVIWDCDLVPTNHMEGHIYASLITGDTRLSTITYPSLALLISGNHTELVLISTEHNYTILGQTLDDAVGEAYDKSARLLGLPYPGGPLVSQMAELARTNRGQTNDIVLPRPMLHSQDLNFSLSGLKTAVRYLVQSQTRLSKKFKESLCLEFENAVSDVLVHKTSAAIVRYNIKNLIIGGGVSANTNIRREMQSLCDRHHIKLFLPSLALSGDNALMINLAGYRRWKKNTYPRRIQRVKGNLTIGPTRTD